ncbi:MAG: class F sortase [bacterium]|nr:class F sortase [bacterium]
MKAKPLQFHKHQGHMSLVFIIGLIIFAVISFVFFITSQKSAPSLPASADRSTQNDSSQVDADAILPLSRPTEINIPSIDVRSSLITVGKNPDGTIEVPGAADYNKAAWYRNSPTPGQLGSSIIEGHLDFIGKGPAIFFRLAELRAGDIVEVLREDGVLAKFAVDNIATYNKEEFPTNKVYGITNRPALVLITCGGEFNGMTGEYDSNVVAFATLISS